ncbi:MAG TPA: ABC transporter substrate-binding protein [Streptosporangiaceae bacterium]|nr:ABC transporter substrate-binding protein [Streptosporangiaceae bacterium]
MFRYKRLSSLAAVVAAAGLIAACGNGGGNGGGQAEGQGPARIVGNGALKVGYILPETGQLAFLGPPQIQGMKMAIAQINAAGGVLGKQVPPAVTGDEAGDQSVAQQSADRVLAADVQAIVGAAASGMTLAIIDKITGARVVQCSASNTAPTFTNYNDNGYYFRTAPSDALQGPVLADTIVGDGHSNVAIVARADDYGRGLANATAQSLRQSGATVALNSTYDPTTTNFEAVVQRVVNAKPDAVVVLAFEEGTQILKGLIEAGYGPKDVAVYGADGLRSEELAKLVAPKNPSVIAGMKGTAPASAENARFTAALKAFDPKLKELQYAPQAFDCMTIIGLAAQQANSNNPEIFKNDMVSVTKGGTKCSAFADCKRLINNGTDIDYQGVSGPVDLIPAGEPGEATIEVYSYNQDGKLTTVRTVESKPVG